ncbi:MAG: SET domain-containing protein-lysine N-methyltransferase [Sphingobacteriales bacterium]|nr:MAG: SET domain-containing protein-lysine N-methyltransferase [Sphingobacteriales bacterium]
MIHPHTELRYLSAEKGYGVIATQFIPKGTITWIADELDQVFSVERLKKMPFELRTIIDKYSYRDSNGEFILCWDHARFINHSFSANCITTAYNFDMAVRDIQPGEELTNDYGYLNMSRPLHFAPEEGNSRQSVTPDDLLHFHAEWDAKLINAFRYFNGVEQPLAKFIEEKHTERVRDVSAGRQPMDSILNCYYTKAKRKEAA